jgi:signal transduction histidine kinase
VEEKTTELQRTNDELMKQNDDLLQFSYTVSHNLRGPVARMLGLTNIFRYSRDAAEQIQMIDLVHQSSEDLDQTLRDLSKIIDIRNDLHSIKEWVSLEEKWLICCSLLKDVIKDEFHISHNFERAPKIYTVKAFVQSVFYNLLSNSIKYRSEERNLVVTANSFVEEGKLIIEIKDNGLGIDVEKHKDSIFKMFKRFHTHVEGRGLGLYLIKSQIEALKGSFEIQSVVDQGTCIRLSIPIGTETYPDIIVENNVLRQ